MVSHADAVEAEVLTQLFEIVVAQVAGCHLYADMVKRGIFTRVEVGTMQAMSLSCTS